MTTQPEALKMIYWLEDEDAGVGYTDKEVAAKLRHLHETKAELLDALEELMRWQVKHVDKWNNSAYDNAARTITRIIAKATGETE